MATLNRIQRPLRPSDVKIDGVSFPTTISNAGNDLVFTWKNRNRLTENQIVKQSTSSVSVEVSAKIIIKVYSRLGVLLNTYSNITGTTWTYTVAMQLADTANVETGLSFVIYSIVDTYTSLKAVILDVKRPSGTLPASSPNYTPSGTYNPPIVVGGYPTTNTPVTNQVPVYNTDGTITWVDLPLKLETKTINVTTSSLANNASENISVLLGKSFLLYKIETNVIARVRVYQNDAYRTADASRLVGVFPTGEHGVIVDVLTYTGNLAIDLSPIVSGKDNGGAGGNIPLAIQNRSGVTSTVTVTFTFIKLEI